MPASPPVSDGLVPALSAAWPTLVHCRQQGRKHPLDDAALVAAVRDGWAKAGMADRIRPGQSVAITAGSRGIDRYPLVLREAVRLVRASQGVPFIFPAMGSHGGATAAGQTRLLADMGIDETTMGCPIRATMDVVDMGTSASGVTAYLDAHAAAADHIILVNRIKEHTNFHGVVESGLCKMLVIGAGKHAQAIALHVRGTDALARHIPSVAATILARAPVLCGIGLIEDATHRLCAAHVVPAQRLLTDEPDLLRVSTSYGLRLPADDIDLLIVDRCGKDISGTGMDTNVIGRCRLLDFHAFPTPRVRALVVLGLTEATHGNSIGVGMADLIPRRLADQVDRRITSINCITGLSPAMAALPIVLEHDRAVIRTALDYFTGGVDPTQARVVRIRDTLHLTDVWASPAITSTLADRPAWQVTDCAAPLTFDDHGNLLPCPTTPEST